MQDSTSAVRTMEPWRPPKIRFCMYEFLGETGRRTTDPHQIYANARNEQAQRRKFLGVRKELMTGVFLEADFRRGASAQM